MQPSFIFGRTETTITTTDGVKLSQPKTAQDLKQSSQYYLGVGLCLLVAAIVAVSNVINVKIKKSNEDVRTTHLVLMTGVFSILLSLLSTVFLPNRLITEPLSMPLSSTLALPVAAVMTLLAFWFITLAVTITQLPTLISMLRSTEIIISLGTEAVWWGQPPHYLSVIGSLLV